MFTSTDADVQVKASLDPDAGTLVVESNVPEVDLFINEQKHTMPVRAQTLAIALPPDTYAVRATRQGYAAYGPVQVSIAKDAATVLRVELKPETNSAVLKTKSVAETDAVLAVLRRYANAWNTKDLDTIVALQRNLKKRTVRKELAPVKSIVMKLSPTSVPQVQGERAMVVCRRQVNEVFPNGVQKQSPEQFVTFVLAKQNGIWAIESAR